MRNELVHKFRVAKVSICLMLSMLVGCQTLVDTARVVAKPALVVLVSSLMQNNPDWQTAITVISQVLDESMRANPDQVPEETEQLILDYLLENNVGTEEERDQVMREVREALYDTGGQYSSSGVSGSVIVLQSFQKALIILSAGTVDYTDGGIVRLKRAKSVEADPSEVGIPVPLGRGAFKDNA